MSFARGNIFMKKIMSIAENKYKPSNAQSKEQHEILSLMDKVTEFKKRKEKVIKKLNRRRKCLSYEGIKKIQQQKLPLVWSRCMLVLTLTRNDYEILPYITIQLMLI